MSKSQRIGWICQSSALPVFLMLLKALIIKKGMSLVSGVNLNNMTKNRIRVTSLSGCVTEILMLHRMTKVYQNYRFF